MRILSSINENCLKTYTPHSKCLASWPEGKIHSFILQEWDSKIPKSLQEQCVGCIAKNWIEYPLLDEIILLDDRYLLLDILPTTLPLELTIPKIHAEIYWKKCYVDRWPKKVPKTDSQVQLFSRIVREGINEINERCIVNHLGHKNLELDHVSFTSKQASRRSSNKETIMSIAQGMGKSWKMYYCEMHVQEYLEKLKPEDYNPEKIKDLCDLFGPYVEVLNIHEMISSENSPNKIPLNSIVTGFPHLKELCLRFKQDYAKEEFSWNMVNTSHHDIILLAKGLEKLRLNKLSITNSDIDCEKVIAILRALMKNDPTTLDFTRCKIGDKGMTALSKFIIEKPITELYVANNRIGPKGAMSLAYALSQDGCKVRVIDVHLNQLCDIATSTLINALVRNNESVKRLYLSACGLTENIKLAKSLARKSYLEELDISNNALGEETGRNILKAMERNTTLKKLDLRMCKIPSEVEAQIQNKLFLNRKGINRLDDEDLSDDEDILWDIDLVEEFNDVLTANVKSALQIDETELEEMTPTKDGE